MFLAELCVKRPVFATMLILCLVVMGWFSYGRLGLDLLPKIDRPTVTITTKLAGGSPEGRVCRASGRRAGSAPALASIRMVRAVRSPVSRSDHDEARHDCLQLHL